MERDIKDLTEFLEKQLEKTNSWLSFAEAKNAAIIALNIALAPLCLDLIEKACFPLLIRISLLVLVIATLISLSSFKPKLFAHPAIEPKGLGNKTHSTNLMFFGSVAEITDEEELLKEITKQYFEVGREMEYDQLDVDLAKELLENSRIANRKFKLFDRSLTLDILTILMLVADYLATWIC